jgi:hypothetical protein
MVSLASIIEGRCWYEMPGAGTKKWKECSMSATCLLSWAKMKTALKI